MNQHFHHFVHYLLLVLILITGFVMFLIAPQYNISRFCVIISTTSAYVLWGIIHHWVEKRLDVRIIIEYMLIGLLVISLLGLVVSH